MKEHKLVILIIIINLLFLLYGINSLSISYDEANILFNGTDFLHYLVYFSTKLFGLNDFAIRLPFVLLHILSLILLYKIGKLFLKRKIDRVVSIGLYAMLPGVNSAALLVNSAYIVIFCTLLFVYLYLHNYKKLAYFALLLFLFLDNAFAFLYLSIFFYAVFNRKKDLLWFSLLLFGISMYIFGFDTQGKPKGYFLDTLGAYAAILSVFVLLYFIYVMYRILIKEDKNILWYISFVPFILSLLLSLRQKVMIEDFAPYVVISIPLMVKVFFNSYRVRLPQHRKYHKSAFVIVFVFLAFNFLISCFNKPLYLILKNPNKHFAYKYHIAKDLAKILKSKGIYSVILNDDRLALRLIFYGIKTDKGTYKLVHSNFNKRNFKTLSIKYCGRIIKQFYIGH